MIASSRTNQRIAEHLGMNAADVSTLRGMAMQRTGLFTRIQIINYPRAHGWINASGANQAPPLAIGEPGRQIGVQYRRESLITTIRRLRDRIRHTSCFERIHLLRPRALLTETKGSRR
jgi:hypothetical protein